MIPPELMLPVWFLRRCLGSWLVKLAHGIGTGGEGRREEGYLVHVGARIGGEFAEGLELPVYGVEGVGFGGCV